MKTNPSVLVLSYYHILYGDASGTGLFLLLICDKIRTLLSQYFFAEEKLKSSIFRDVCVFWRIYMETNLESYKNSSILHYTDSRAAQHIIQDLGYRNPEIQSIFYSIVLKARVFGISLAARWVSREDEEMKLTYMGSRGPCFPAQEVSRDSATMCIV